MSNDDSDDERLVAEIDSDLKDRAKADPRTIREIVEASLQREFATGATAAIERRIDEKKQRINTLEREINDRERELANERDELARLQAQLESHADSEEDKLEEVRNALQQHDGSYPTNPENPAVVNWAGKLNLPPQELLDRL